MVHALEATLSLLVPGGLMLVVHDTRIPPVLVLQRDGQDETIGWMVDREGYSMIRSADEAVDRCIRDGFIEQGSSKVFKYRTLVDSYPALKEWLDDEWDSSYLPDRYERRLAAIYSEHGGKAAVFVRRTARIRTLRVV